jgi:hypothetical protein
VNKKNIAADLGIELAGSAIVAAIVWLATLASQTIDIPTWAVITIAGSVTTAVAFLVAYVVRARHLRRMEADLRAAQESGRNLTRALDSIRNIIRIVADQLLQGDKHTTLKCITSYTVDADGQDRTESSWTIAYEKDHHGRVFTTEDWSAQPPDGDVTCTCQSDDGTSIQPVLVVDEPTYKQFVLFLNPAVGTTPRTIVVRQTWPGLWNELRSKGTDYVELTARTGLQEAITHIHIPIAVGPFKWAANGNGAIELSESMVGGQQTLSFVVKNPQGGTKYRADLVRAQAV